MASREMYTFDFSGLRVFLTGGGRGMGRGIAEAFAKSWGATVGVTEHQRRTLTTPISAGMHY